MIWFLSQRLDTAADGSRIASRMRVHQVEASEMEVVRDQMQREGIELISGTARFMPGVAGEPHRVMVLRTSEKAEAKTRSVCDATCKGKRPLRGTELLGDCIRRTIIYFEGSYLECGTAWTESGVRCRGVGVDASGNLSFSTRCVLIDRTIASQSAPSSRWR